MKVRYVCDSCRSVIAEFDDPGLTEERRGLDQLTSIDRDQLVQQLAEAVVLSTLCDECAEVLSASEYGGTALCASKVH